MRRKWGECASRRPDREGRHTPKYFMLTPVVLRGQSPLLVCSNLYMKHPSALLLEGTHNGWLGAPLSRLDCASLMQFAAGTSGSVMRPPTKHGRVPATPGN